MPRLKILYQNILDELDLILKNRTLISILLVSPIFYTLFYGSIYLNKTNHELFVGIIDHQNSENSRRLFHEIQSSSKIKIHKSYSSIDESMQDLSDNIINAIILIPNNFDTYLNKEKQAVVQLYINNSRFLISNEINKSLNEVIFNYNQELLKLKFLKRSNLNQTVSQEPINIDIRNIFNTTESYGDFLIPAIFLLILHQTLLMASSTSVKLSLEKKYLENSFGDFYLTLIAKMIVYIFFYVAYSLFINTVIIDYFNIPTTGSLFYLILISFNALIPTFILGALLATFFKDRLLLFQLITLSSYPVFILSGYSWPKSSIPEFINFLSQLIPFTNYSELYQKFLLFGSSFSSSVIHFIILLILTFLYALFLHKRIKLIKP